MDKNASIISVRVFKQLWMDDYYLFYMDVVAVNGKFESRPMRRYNVIVHICRIFKCFIAN